MTKLKKWPWEKSLPSDVNWQSDIPTYTLPDMFTKSVKQWHNKTAIDFLGKTLSYEELGVSVNCAAKGLQINGVVKNSRVGIMLPNCPAYVIMYWATLCAGGIVVNLNPLYTREELATQIQDSGIDFLISLDLKELFFKAESMLQNTQLKKLIVVSLSKELPIIKNFLFRIFKQKNLAKFTISDKIINLNTLIKNDGVYKKPSIDQDDVAVLQYTGGTTGFPKAAMLTHKNLSANIEQGTLFFPQTEAGKEVILCVLPLFHVFAMTVVMNFAIRNGGKIVLLPKFDINQMLKTIIRTKVTFFPAVPTIYIAVNNHPNVKSGKMDLSSIKACLSGGDTLPTEVKEVFEKNTGCKLVEGYGLSETSPIAACNPSTGESRQGSLGLPAPQTIFEITSIEDPKKVLALGDMGEICISGPQIMKGYWEKPSETEKALDGGRFHTGDVGYIDDDGYVYLIDRIKEVIISSGYNVYPRYIEEAIYKHSAVEEVTVIGIPDSYRGQSAKAFVRISEGHDLTPDDLLEFIKDKLSPIECPKEIEFRSELPKTAVGKLSKKELIEEIEKNTAI